MNTRTLTLAALAALGLSGLGGTALAQDTATPTAQEQCRTLRTQMGAEAFKQAYGTNKNRSNAFGKCVSKRAAATEQAQAAARTNAAKECKAERTADPAAFAAKYGTGRSKGNAYGKCVSAKARAKTTKTVEQQVAATVSAAKACKAERKADPAAFKAKYGTNRNKSNAFGKCVSAQAKAQQDDEPAQA